MHFEDKMFSKRHALNALVLAECAEHKGRFLPDVINGIFSICDEGAQYYRHAGLCLFLVLSVCDSVTGGAFQHLFSNEKIRNIASYIYRVHIADQYYINFADCSPVAGRCSVREYLFAKLTGQEDMIRFAAKDFLAGKKASLLLPSENNLFYRLLSGFYAAEIKAFDCSGAQPAPDLFYPSAGLFAARDEHFFLAVKAGDNADSHNHNDVGSFTVYKDGLPLLIDIGVESYTKKTFSPQRYEIWTMQSAWHNLPAFDGITQKDGEEYCAKDVSCSLSDSSISMDIAPAYPSGSPVSSYRRSAHLYKGEKIRITDTFSFRDDLPHRVVLSLMTYEKPRIVSSLPKSQDIAVPVGTDAQTTAQLTLSGGRVSSIEEIPITDARLLTAWKHPIYRMLIEPLTGSRQFELEIR